MEKENDRKRGTKLRMTVAFFSAAGFLAVLLFIYVGAAGRFDDTIRCFFYGFRNDILTPAAKAITYLGNWQSIGIICIVLLAVKQLRMTYGVPVSAGAIFVTIINKIIKEAVGRYRPDDILHLTEAGGFSFPSGHSVTSMFVFGTLICLVRINVKSRAAANILTVILAVPMICIGLSRIYLGVHYPTDVIAGWLLGILVMMIVIEIYICIFCRRENHL